MQGIGPVQSSTALQSSNSEYKQHSAAQGWGQDTLEANVALFPERNGGGRVLPIGLPHADLPDPSYHFYLELGQFAQFKPAYFLDSDDVTEPGFQKAGVAKNTCLLERKENY